MTRSARPCGDLPEPVVETSSACSSPSAPRGRHRDRRRWNGSCRSSTTRSTLLALPVGHRRVAGRRGRTDEGSSSPSCRAEQGGLLALVPQALAVDDPVAMVFVSRRSVAEEVVQETWLEKRSLRGLDRYEGRSSLRHDLRDPRDCPNGAGSGATAHAAGRAAAEAAGDDLGVSRDRSSRTPSARMWSTLCLRWTIYEERLLLGELRTALLEGDRRATARSEAVDQRRCRGLAVKICRLSRRRDEQPASLHRARAAAARRDQAVPSKEDDADLRDIVKLITDYTEGAPARDPEHRRFEEHVSICPPCRSFLDQMRTTSEAWEAA